MGKQGETNNVTSHLNTIRWLFASHAWPTVKPLHFYLKLFTSVISRKNPNVFMLVVLIDFLANNCCIRLCVVIGFRQQRKRNAWKSELRAKKQKNKKPSRPRQFWSSGASVCVMALSLLLLVLSTGLLLCILLIIRLCLVVKNGSTRVPGNKTPVAVLAVAGSGNAKYLRILPSSPGFFQGRFPPWIPSGSAWFKMVFVI